MKRFKLHVGDITDYNVPKFGTFLPFTIYAMRNIIKSGKGIVPKFGTKGAYYEEIIII